MFNAEDIDTAQTAVVFIISGSAMSKILYVAAREGVAGKSMSRALGRYIAVA